MATTLSKNQAYDGASFIQANLAGNSHLYHDLIRPHEGSAFINGALPSELDAEYPPGEAHSGLDSAVKIDVESPFHRNE